MFTYDISLYRTASSHVGGTPPLGGLRCSGWGSSHLGLPGWAGPLAPLQQQSGCLEEEGCQGQGCGGPRRLNAKAAHEALVAKQVEVANRYAEEEARRGRQAIADEQRRRSAFRAAGQRANQEEEVQMGDMGQSSDFTPPAAPPHTPPHTPGPNGELM